VCQDAASVIVAQLNGADAGENSLGHPQLQQHAHGCFAGYFTAAMFVMITFSLLRVQEALEVSLCDFQYLPLPLRPYLMHYQHTFLASSLAR